MNGGISVLVPVLNEEDIIEANTARLMEFLRELDRPFEVLVVSNGSTDRTEELARGLAVRFQELRCFSLPQKGVGRAFSLGVRESSHERIVCVDMDLSIDLNFVTRAVDLLDDYEIVVGSKKMGAQKRAFWRKAGSGLFILTARLLLGLDFEDYSIAAKAYHREVILKHLDRIDHGTSYVLDIIFLTLKSGGRAVEIPVYCEDYRTSKFNLLDEALYRFRNLFRLWWEYRLTATRRKEA